MCTRVEDEQSLPEYDFTRLQDQMEPELFAALYEKHQQRPDLFQKSYVHLRRLEGDVEQLIEECCDQKR